jgi:hypothetical protein
LGGKTIFGRLVLKWIFEKQDVKIQIQDGKHSELCEYINELLGSIVAGTFLSR